MLTMATVPLLTLQFNWVVTPPLPLLRRKVMRPCTWSPSVPPPRWVVLLLIGDCCVIVGPCVAALAVKL